MKKTRLCAVNFIRKSWSDWFNNGIVYNIVGFKCICATIFKPYTELFYKLFTRAIESGWSMGGYNFKKIPPINVPKCYGGKFDVFEKKLSKSSDIFHLEPGLYPSIRDNVEAMNNLILQKQNHSENCIKVKMSRRTEKVEIYLATERSGLAPFSMGPGHIFGSNVGNEVGVMLRRRRPHKPELVYDIVRIHSLMIYTDLIEYNIVGDTKAPLLRCFPFISKLKSGDIITNGQYMNYQTFSNMQFRPPLKNFFHSIHVDLGDTSGEKKLFVSVGITRLVLMFQKSLQHSFLI